MNRGKAAQLLHGVRAENDSIDLGGGNNSIVISGITKKGSVTIAGGRGQNTADFGSGDTVIKKDLTVEFGDGSNLFTMAATSLQVGGDLSDRGGVGADSVSMLTAIP